jgi:hypothetical protein
MFNTKTVLSQLQSFIFGYDFKNIIDFHQGDKGVKTFKTRNLLSIMLYMHMTSKKSLRDIVDSLSSKRNLWYHLGLASVSRNNLSYALANRSCKIFEQSFYWLLQKLQHERGFVSDKRFKFKMPVKILDSTTISLCLSLFDWATFREAKGGIKLHVMFDAREQIPDFVVMSTAKQHDIQAARHMELSKNSIFVMDKGYICFDFLAKINKNSSFFVTRTKTNTQYKILERRKKTNRKIKADWIVKFSSYRKKDYPELLRVVRYRDDESGKTYEYMTNNFSLSAMTIADIYKSRWDIELFFKWIKQNLKIKTFIGTSENAVLIQVWTAMIAYLLTEYIRFKSKTGFSRLKTYRILCDNILHNYDIQYLLHKKESPDLCRKKLDVMQLSLEF